AVGGGRSGLGNRRRVVAAASGSAVYDHAAHAAAHQGAYQAESHDGRRRHSAALLLGFFLLALRGRGVEVGRRARVALAGVVGVAVAGVALGLPVTAFFLVAASGVRPYYA